jgi:hypothetical protein
MLHHILTEMVKYMLRLPMKEISEHEERESRVNRQPSKAEIQRALLKRLLWKNLFRSFTLQK